MGGTTWAMVALAFAIGASSAPTPPKRTGVVFACGFADGKSVSVAQAGARLTYEFGLATRPEIQLTGGPGANLVFKHSGSAPRAGWMQLRFVNGTTSYVVFHYYNLGNFVRDYEGATEQSGLFVYLHGRRVAKRLCRTGDGFLPDVDLSQIPEDGEVDIVDNF